MAKRAGRLRELCRCAWEVVVKEITQLASQRVFASAKWLILMFPLLLDQLLFGLGLGALCSYS